MECLAVCSPIQPPTSRTLIATGPFIARPIIVVVFVIVFIIAIVRSVFELVKRLVYSGKARERGVVYADVFRRG